MRIMTNNQTITTRLNQNVQSQFIEEKLKQIKDSPEVKKQIKSLIDSNNVVGLYNYLLTTLVPEDYIKKPEKEAKESTRKKAGLSSFEQFKLEVTIVLQDLRSVDQPQLIDLDTLVNAKSSFEKMISLTCGNQQVTQHDFRDLNTRLGKLEKAGNIIALVADFYLGILYYLAYENLPHGEKNKFIITFNLDRSSVSRKINFSKLIKKFPSLLNSGQSRYKIMQHEKDLIKLPDTDDLYAILIQEPNCLSLVLNNIITPVELFTPESEDKIMVDLSSSSSSQSSFVNQVQQYLTQPIVQPVPQQLSIPVELIKQISPEYLQNYLDVMNANVTSTDNLLYWHQKYIAHLNNLPDTYHSGSDDNNMSDENTS